MRKKYLPRILISFFLFTVSLPAEAMNINRFIVDKNFVIDRKTGFILSSDLEKFKKNQISPKTFVATEREKKGNYFGEKKYTLENRPESFNSLVVVRDSSGKEIKKISVGRQAFKIIQAPKSKRIFVLCRGYFGSVWEIDSQNDFVVRKYLTSWEPTDLIIDSQEKFLYVTSGKLQKFSIDSDVTFEIKIPEEINYLSAINPLSGDSFVVSGIDREGEIKYFQIEKNEIFLKSFSGVNRFITSSTKTLSTEKLPTEVSSNLALMYSRNNDFVYVFSPEQKKMIAMIPLDAKVDQLLYSSSQKKVYVLHRSISQISVVDLEINNQTTFSVISRIVDERLSDPTNLMVYQDERLFIKSDFGQEGYIDNEDLLRFTSPLVDIPLNRESELLFISNFAKKRFYKKNNQLFYEDINENDPQISRKVRLDIFGNNVNSLELSNDGRTLFVGDFSDNSVTAIDTQTTKIIKKYLLPSKPGEIIFASNQKELFIINSEERNIISLTLSSGDIQIIERLKTENNNLSQIKIFDSLRKQLIKINNPLEINRDFSVLKIR